MKTPVLILFSGLLLLGASPGSAQSEATASDGWISVDVSSAGLDASALSRMEAAITSGQFKKITSVLIARHGKLAYEKYFDGDATTLRDTRSATKSITSMVTGIAIDQRALPSLDARVFSIFPEKQPLAKPRSAQGCDHGGRHPYHELAARMRRLERVLARQRRAHVRDRGLGQVLPRSAGEGFPALGHEAAGVSLWPQLQLLHCRSNHPRGCARESNEEETGRLRSRQSIHAIGHPAGAVGLFTARACPGWRRPAVA